MKYAVLTLLSLICLSAPAAAESQTYSRYGVATNYAEKNQQQNQQVAQARKYEQVPNIYMVYPGREEYGQHFGPLPRHPGDYRDAVDRGSWSGGINRGGTGARAFDIQ